MKTKLFIFLIFLFLLLCSSAFLIGKKLLTGETISDEDNPDYSAAPMGSPEDKNCVKLRNGKTACKIGTFEINSGEVVKIDLDQ